MTALDDLTSAAITYTEALMRYTPGNKIPYDGALDRLMRAAVDYAAFDHKNTPATPSQEGWR